MLNFEKSGFRFYGPKNTLVFLFFIFFTLTTSNHFAKDLVKKLSVFITNIKLPTFSQRFEI